MNTSFRNWILSLALFAPMSFGVHAATPWQQVTADATPPAHAMHAVAAGNNGLLAAGSACSMKASLDGLHWIKISMDASECFFHDIAWNGSRYLVVGELNGGTALWEYDGNSWWTHTSFPGVTWHTVTALPGDDAGFMIIGRASDGFIKVWWYERPSPLTLGPSLGITQQINGVIWDGSRFVAVGQRGTIMTSADGSGWVSQASGTFADLRGIAFNSTRNTYVAVGDNNTILYSQDQAQTWFLRTVLSPHQLLGVAWNGEKFVAVGTGNRVLSSSTGSIWFEERVANLPTSTYLHDVAWSPALKRWIAVGENGVVLTSESIFSGHFEGHLPSPYPY